eukprot:UN3535
MHILGVLVLLDPVHQRHGPGEGVVLVQGMRNPDSCLLVALLGVVGIGSGVAEAMVLALPLLDRHRGASPAVLQRGPGQLLERLPHVERRSIQAHGAVRRDEVGNLI